MYKLYDAVFSADEKKRQLYLHSDKDVEIYDNTLLFRKSNSKADLLTYFNSFSIYQWKKYTYLTRVRITGKITGQFDIAIYTLSENAEKKILLTESDINSLDAAFDLNELDGDILGIQFISKCGGSSISSLAYLGEFTEWHEKRIGIVICTYKREKYVQATTDKLQIYMKDKSWLSVLVVDNGKTLKECNTDRYQVIHNPNYGGSGGFTRGIIENLDSGRNEYVLLMDDDIDLETSSLDRVHSLLCGVKEQYKESFLSGAMLNMDFPNIQYENTAYWEKIKFCSLGRNLDLSEKGNLLRNIIKNFYANQYAAWWFCCIPLGRIRQIGLPLPVFIKGDDLEYSIRNNREIIILNGVGVWHEAFEKKVQPWTNYFADRNMLMINHFAAGCGFMTMVVSLILRTLRRVKQLDKLDLAMLNQSLCDYKSGLQEITKINAEIKLQSIRNPVLHGGTWQYIRSIVKNCFSIILNYRTIDKKYKDFLSEELSDSRFWIKYLRL